MSNDKICLNVECTQNNVIATEFDIFSSVDFSIQLKTTIRKYFEINNYLIEERDFIDIVDAKYYQKIRKSNKLHLICYTDGVQLVKSSNHQCWPVVVSLVELPSKIRDSNQNKIFCGLWFGKYKPSSDILFSTMTSQLDAINENGIDIVFSQKSYTLSIGLYGLLADTPAKALAMMIKNFNGRYGCPYCINPGIYH